MVAKKMTKKTTKKIVAEKKLPTFKDVKSFFRAYEKGKLPKNTAIRYDCGAFVFECSVGDIGRWDYAWHTFLEIKTTEGELKFLRYCFKRAGIKIKIDEE